MKIGFVSLMRVASWGGSEALWSKTALLALAQGHAVETLTYHHQPEAPQIAKLRQAGAVTKFYDDDSPAVLDRLAVKLKLKKRQSETLPTMTADIFVLSNGSIWDFIRSSAVTNHILVLGKPYILLSHNTREFGENLNEEREAYAASVLRNAAARLFVSERNRQGAERQLARPLGECQIVGNPVNIRQARIKPFPVAQSLLMASVGSLTCDYKGQDILLEALSSDAWKERDFRLKIYGTGPDTAYLHRLIELYGLQGNVTLEGHVSDVDQIWATSQVLVLSSTSEGVPMVVVEAMLSGRAVLSTDVGAVERYVLEGETGFLVPVANAKYLAAGLEKLWENRASLPEMGAKAYRHAIAVTDAKPEQSFLALIKAALTPGA